jgi:3-deoxy-D-manno-octulosonate 8-phosphate phosphatase (KDO 8-P phosphatase)
LKLLVLDVDGVLTEGELILVGSDLEAKRFDFHDGLGVMLLQQTGIKVALLSDRESAALSRRATEMGIDRVAPVARRDKGASLDALIAEMDVTVEEVAFVGDDLRDVPAMRMVAMPLAVANARPEVKGYSVYVTHVPGGHGAVREVAEWLLELRGEKESVIAPMLECREDKIYSSYKVPNTTLKGSEKKWASKLLRLFSQSTRS